jgi:hypothetical protein
MKLASIWCKIFGHSKAFEYDSDSTEEFPTGRHVCLVCKYVFGGVGKVVIVHHIENHAGSGGGRLTNEKPFYLGSGGSGGTPKSGGDGGIGRPIFEVKEFPTK